MKLLILFLITSVSTAFADLNFEQDRSFFKIAQERRLLIIGCARSGTMYTAALLNEAGLCMGHEMVYRDGCVGWQATALTHPVSWWENYGTRFPVTYRYIFHQIRNPIHGITSLYRKKISPHRPRDGWDNAFAYMEQFTPGIKDDDPPLLFCAKYWYYWNKMAEKKASWTYRIEDIDTALAEIGKRIGVALDLTALERVPKDVNTGLPSEDHAFEVTWALLEQELPRRLFLNIKKLAKKYGYSVIDE